MRKQPLKEVKIEDRPMKTANSELKRKDKQQKSNRKQALLTSKTQCLPFYFRKKLNKKIKTDSDKK